LGFDSFDVVFDRSGALSLIDEYGRDLHDNVLIHGMRGTEVILVLVSRTGLDDYFGWRQRGTLAQWNSVVDRYIDIFNRIALAKLKNRKTLTLFNPFEQAFTGVFISGNDIKQSGETLTIDVLQTAEMASFGPPAR